LKNSYEKGLDMSMDAGQEHAIQTFDQQLYAIAQQVKWSRPGIFEPHILRLGVKCFTPVHKGRYMHNFKGLKYKCESPDSPVELFSYQHLFNCATGINIRVNQPYSGLYALV
jgi:hypothetical protein